MVKTSWMKIYSDIQLTVWQFHELKKKLKNYVYLNYNKNKKTKNKSDIINITILHYYSRVALIAKFCVNIAFSGAIRILAASPRHHTQNDWTSIQEVTAHWWLPCHSTLDRFANSMWSQQWLRTPPHHHKSNQWRAESGRWNKHASCRYFGLYGDYEAVNKTHVDIKYEWEKMAAASISTSSRYQIPR